MNSDLLQKSLDYGIIDPDNLAELIEKMEREKCLERHDYKIWQGGNGCWYTYLVRDGERRLVKKSSKKLIEDAVIEHYKIETTLQEAFDLWIQSKLDYGEIKKQSADRYKNQFKEFYGGAAAKKPLSQITEEWLEDYMKRKLVELKLPQRSWTNVKTITRGMFMHAKKNKLTRLNISAFLDELEVTKNVIRKPDKSNQVFTEREVEMILAECERSGTPTDFGIEIAVYTGLRSGEIAALKYSDINGRIMTVQRTCIAYKNEDDKITYGIQEFTKGAEGSRKVVVTKEVTDVIEKLRKSDERKQPEFIFYGRLQKGAFTNRLYRICRKLGIPPRSLHKARKTYATKLIDAHVPDALVISQMGHTDILTTRNHYYFNSHEVEEAEKLLEEIF